MRSRSRLREWQTNLAITLPGIGTKSRAKYMNSTITDRTTHLLELMKKGDDAFNSRDVAGMNATHQPDIIAHVMGIAKPINGRKAHAAMIQHMMSVFPDIRVHNDPYPIQFGSGDCIVRSDATF
jgi:hypothetical protein